MNPEVPMSDENDTNRLTGDDGSLAGDALLHAVRRDMLGLFKALDHKVEALDAKVEARLRDTTPMWEVVVSRLDTLVAEQESHGRHLDAIEGRLDAIETEQRRQGARLDAIEAKLERFDAIDSELRHLRRRIERTIGQLSKDVVEYRVDQHDLEDRLEKIEKTPA
jgi:chromosome segregation ATPase